MEEGAENLKQNNSNNNFQLIVCITKKIVKGIKSGDEWYFRQGSVLISMPAGKRISPSDGSNRDFD